MVRHKFSIVLASALVAVAACAGDGAPRGDPAPVAAADEPSVPDGAAKPAQPMGTDAALPSTTGEPEPVIFIPGAFPPTLPRDDAHGRAWLRTDCILCHEGGIAGAPIVQHAGMSGALLGASCRTCHVVAGEPAAGEVSFARRAFPPTLPADSSHEGAWLRDDCLDCHETGKDSAPRVLHQGMSSALLAASCRTCHVPESSAAGGG